MNIHALFDKIAVDLERSGAVATTDEGGTSVLAFEGREFARLVGDRMSFRLPQGSPALDDTLALRSSRSTGEPDWVEVDATDVSEWPHLAERALAGLRD